MSSWFELVGLDGSTRIVRVPGPSSLTFDGWRGDEPVAERLSGDQSMDLIAISADGRVVVLSTITTGTTQALTSTVAVDWLQP